MSIAAKRNLASAIFVALLLLSVFWPAPVVAINDFCCHAPLRVDAPMGVALFLASIAIVALGIIPGFALDFARDATLLLAR